MEVVDLERNNLHVAWLSPFIRVLACNLIGINWSNKTCLHFYCAFSFQLTVLKYIQCRSSAIENMSVGGEKKKSFIQN